MPKPTLTIEQQTERSTRVVPRKYTDTGSASSLRAGVMSKEPLCKATKIPAPIDTNGDNKKMSRMASCRKYVPVQLNPGCRKKATKDPVLVAGNSLLYVNQLKHHRRSTNIRSLYRRVGIESGVENQAAGPSDSGQPHEGASGCVVSCGEEPTGSNPRSEENRPATRGIPDTAPDNTVPVVQVPATSQVQLIGYPSELQRNGEMEGKDKGVRKFFCW